MLIPQVKLFEREVIIQNNHDRSGSYYALSAKYDFEYNNGVLLPKRQTVIDISGIESLTLMLFSTALSKDLAIVSGNFSLLVNPEVIITIDGNTYNVSK